MSNNNVTASIYWVPIMCKTWLRDDIKGEDLKRVHNKIGLKSHPIIFVWFNF